METRTNGGHPDDDGTTAGPPAGGSSPASVPVHAAKAHGSASVSAAKADANSSVSVSAAKANGSSSVPAPAGKADGSSSVPAPAPAAQADDNAPVPTPTPTAQTDDGRAYSVYHPVLPAVCPRRPDLMAFAGDAEGRCEIFTYDRRTRATRQVTDRPDGTVLCSIDADAAVWWFDEDRAGRGEWRYQDFPGGPHRTALPGAAPGRPCGLAMTDHGVAAVGIGGPDGLTVHLGRRGGPSRTVLRTEGHALLCDLSPRGELLAITGAPDSDRAVTLVTTQGATVAVLSGAAERTWALGFAPGRDEPELLVLRERDGRYHLGTWRRSTGLVLFSWCSFDTEVTGRWYPDGTGRVLVRQARHGRGLLFSAFPAARTLTRVPTPRGSLLDAAATPDGDVQYIWTDALTPPRPRSISGAPLPGPPPHDPPPYGHHRDLWTPGPDGPVHTLLTAPTTGPAPHPLVMLVHGGPADHDRDAYDAMVHSLTASGFAVARVNYRGSTGYGPQWRAAFREGVGHTQVTDLAAVRADLLRRGIAREGAIGLCGTSFGGYLALLAAGTHPDLWNAAVAVKPIADYATAFHHTTPALRALDTALFGGTPDEVPERYAHASPLTYAHRITAPLLLVAARQDAKCPPEQIEAYAGALRERGVPYELMWLDSGHDGYDGAHHVAVMERSLRFLARAPAAAAAAAPPAPATSVPAPSGAGPNPTANA